MEWNRDIESLDSAQVSKAPSRNRAICRPSRVRVPGKVASGHFPPPRIPPPSILRRVWSCRYPYQISVSTGRSTVSISPAPECHRQYTTPNLISNLLRTSISTLIPHTNPSLSSHPSSLVLSRPLTRESAWDTSALAESTVCPCDLSRRRHRPLRVPDHWQIPCQLVLSTSTLSSCRTGRILTSRC